MTTWTSDELSRIEQADELEIAPLRSDGTPGRATPVWVVRDGDDIHVRSYHGRGATWFRAATAAHAGHISSGGLEKDVTFTEVDDPALADRLDAGYRAKYREYSPAYVDPLLSEDARAATLRIFPR